MRRNAVIAMFDTTAARTLAFGDVGTAGNVGSAAGGGGFVAARDHGHAMPGNAIVASVGNVLAVASTNGNLTWGPQNFTNPMTTLGDLIYGGAAGAVARLPIVASTGNYLGVASTNGNLAWSVPPTPAAGTTVFITTTEVTSSFTTASTGYTNITNFSLVCSTTDAANEVEVVAFFPLVYASGAATADLDIYNSTDAAIVNSEEYFGAVGIGGTNEGQGGGIYRMTTFATGGKTLQGRAKVSGGFTLTVYGAAGYAYTVTTKEYR